MTTIQRIKLLLPTLRKFPALGISQMRELKQLVELELGDIAALDRWVAYGSGQTRARAPRRLYLLCAHTLAVSAWQGITRGLLLGAQITVKTSSSQHREIRRFVAELPPALRQLVKLEQRFSPSSLQAAEVVMAFGSDTTLAEVRRQLRPEQKWIGYGHQVSLLWLGQLTRFSPALLASAADDICTYDQQGCLSPQAIYLHPQSDAAAFCTALAKVLATRPRLQLPAREGLTAAALIREARQQFPRARLWSSAPTLDWTILLHQKATFIPSCGYRVIHVHSIHSSQLEKTLQPLRGKISTVGFHPSNDVPAQEAFLSLGVKRFCPIGQCQHPSVFWHHDGRPQLSDLVTWIDREMR